MYEWAAKQRPSPASVLYPLARSLSLLILYIQYMLLSTPPPPRSPLLCMISIQQLQDKVSQVVSVLGVVKKTTLISPDLIYVDILTLPKPSCVCNLHVNACVFTQVHGPHSCVLSLQLCAWDSECAWVRLCAFCALIYQLFCPAFSLIFYRLKTLWVSQTQVIRGWYLFTYKVANNEYLMVLIWTLFVCMALISFSSFWLWSKMTIWGRTTFYCNYMLCEEVQ